MIRALFAMLAVLSFPLMAYAAVAQASSQNDQTHPALTWAMALLNAYIASEIGPLKRRMAKMEHTLRDFLAGVIR